MTRVLLAFTLMALLVPIGVSAEGETATEEDVRDWLTYVAAGDTTKDMLHRIDEGVAELERQQVRRIKRLRGMMDDEDLALFEQERLAWETFMDRHIAAITKIYEGGTIRGVVAGRTKIILLQERLVQLDRLISHHEPD